MGAMAKYEVCSARPTARLDDEVIRTIDPVRNICSGLCIFYYLCFIDPFSQQMIKFPDLCENVTLTVTFRSLAYFLNSGYKELNFSCTKK